MPISSKRFTEVRFMISDLLQRSAWQQLYEDCGTNDLELAKSVANIFSMFDFRQVWKFADYVLKLEADTRREKRNSTLVVSLTLGRIGRGDPKKAINALKTLLVDDHMLRMPVEASLSNLWVYDRRTTEKELFNSWIMKEVDNEDLQRTAVSSSEYLLSKEPKLVEHFLSRIMRLRDPRNKPAKEEGKLLAEKYGLVHRLSMSEKPKGKRSRRKKQLRSRKKK